MSVAGDIIDELAFRPKIKMGTATGLCGAVAVSLFLVIGVSAAGGSDETSFIDADTPGMTKPSSSYAGGTPQPR